MLLSLLVAAAAQSSLGNATTRYAVSEPLTAPKTAPIWSDEFDGKRLDRRKWRYDTSHNRTGWFNGEKQYYAPGAVRVGGGLLTIEARRDAGLRTRADFGGQAYASGKIISQGAGWTYGFVEVRAKLPCGGGMWPAIWMLPVAGAPWPVGGEIDIMEQVSSEPNMVHATVHSEKFVHTKGTQRGAQIAVPTSCAASHRYQMRWTPQAITIGVDDHAYFRVVNDQPGDRGAWPFDRPFNLILNLAVGGSWPGPVDDAALPQRMELDYVRVWPNG